jgi:hypothetical protein
MTTTLQAAPAFNCALCDKRISKTRHHNQIKTNIARPRSTTGQRNAS